jgi:creatinine amidohydrolase
MVLADMTWTEVLEIREDVELVLIPVGSVEQHGPHLAMRMDSSSADQFCRRAADRMVPRLLVAPALPWGISHHHMRFPGTMTLSPDTFTQVLIEVMQSLQQHGFARFMIVNGHGGNEAAIKTAALRAKHELDAVFVAACTWWSFVDKGELAARFPISAHTGHACELETAAARYMMPEIVREEALEPGQLTDFATGLRLELDRYGVTMPVPWEEIALDGTLGDPTLATYEMGEALVEGALDRFCELLDNVLDSPFAFDLDASGIVE